MSAKRRAYIAMCVLLFERNFHFPRCRNQYPRLFIYPIRAFLRHERNLIDSGGGGGEEKRGDSPLILFIATLYQALCIISRTYIEPESPGTIKRPTPWGLLTEDVSQYVYICVCFSLLSFPPSAFIPHNASFFIAYNNLFPYPIRGA